MDDRTGAIRWMVLLHLTLIVCLWLMPLMVYRDLPESVPIHFDFRGKPDSFASKNSWDFWAVPLVGLALGLGALILLRYPKAFNHPRKREVAELPERLRPQVYVVLQQMLLAIFVCVDILLLVIEYGVVASAKSGDMILSLPLIMVLAVAPLGLLVYYLPRIGRTIDRLKGIALTDSVPKVTRR